MALKQKTIVEVDVMKLDRSKFREFTRADGTVAKIATIEVLEMDTHEVVTNKEKQPVRGGGMILHKLGFATEGQSNEERESKAKSTILGDVKRWVKEEEENAPEVDMEPETAHPSDTIDPDSIPF